VATKLGADRRCCPPGSAGVLAGMSLTSTWPQQGRRGRPRSQVDDNTPAPTSPSTAACSRWACLPGTRSRPSPPSPR
jgi:hypothetical protein